MLQLSIAIITWNSARHIRECLESVLESTTHLSHEIILVDNGSTDQTREILTSYQELPQLRTIFLPANLGVAGGRNRCIREAQGKYIWLLDVDTVVNQEAVHTMFTYMEAHPECGICGCKLINRYGMVQDSCRRLPSLSYKINNVLSSILNKYSLFAVLQKKIDDKNQTQFYRKEIAAPDPVEVEYLIGACQMIRREVIAEVGELDEHIFYGSEDADYCLRASRKGWKIIFLPTVCFVHDYQQITNRKIISKMGFIHAKSLFYFFRKHKRF